MEQFNISSFVNEFWIQILVLVVVLSVVLLVGCGGGGKKESSAHESNLVAFLGDSLTNGGFYEGKKMGVSPVERMTEYAKGRWIGLNLAMDGMRCVDHPTPPKDAHAYVFRFGMADQVKGSTFEEVHDHLRESVYALKRDGKTVYITGIINVPDPVRNTILGEWDAEQRAIAIELGAIFIDVRALGQVSMNDDIHPDQEGSDKVSLLIASSIQ